MVRLNFQKHRFPVSALLPTELVYVWAHLESGSRLKLTTASEMTSWKHTDILKGNDVQAAPSSLKQRVGDNPGKQITPALQLEMPFSASLAGTGTAQRFAPALPKGAGKAKPSGCKACGRQRSAASSRSRRYFAADSRFSPDSGKSNRELCAFPVGPDTAP